MIFSKLSISYQLQSINKTKKQQQSSLSKLAAKGGGEMYIDATRGSAYGMGMFNMVQNTKLCHSS